ncbi:hypothetical protein [Herbaspirillum huttiense]|uniref:DNA primase DNAG catalytic core N-terminal domain-containing protein n=1 Tax=Herbaspirillum huttiense subsp. lycopersici TaxID=3074428 RepID=A0ABU2EFS3_9BURK|nr:hypothetical protein [Herbaspirillum huttiense]MDR9846989.1 hypothetical protein [Herbaspirillum huttiense SE1]
MAGNSNEELQEALGQIDIEAWMDREGVRYRHTTGSRGAQLNVKDCPCCGNSNYKVYINAETGLGNCFHGDCETKFNKWKFISAQLGRSVRETVEHVKQVAREQGWRPPRKKSLATSVETGPLRLPASLPIPVKGRNLKYLENRNISADVAEYFDMRICVKGQFEYRSQEGRRMRQDYSNRIILPVFDLEGDLVSFQGRDITGKAEKKYLFPPGFASTGSHLYNGHNAVGAEHICAGEGVFDVAAIKVALDQEMSLRDVVPVGTFGKHLSHGAEDSQLAKIMALRDRGLKVVTIMWDGEKKAINAAIDAGLLLRSMGLTARVAVLPPDKDPNEVPASVVRECFYKAVAITPQVAAKMRLAMKLL